MGLICYFVLVMSPAYYIKIYKIPCLTLLSLSCFSLTWANIDKTLIESSILINLNVFSKSDSTSNAGGRRLSAAASTSIQQSVDANHTSLPEITALTDSLTNTFNSFQNENLLEAAEHAINYITDNKTSFNLNDSDILAGIKSILIAYIKTQSSNEETLLNSIPELTSIVLSNIIPSKVNRWNGSMPIWSMGLSKVLMESISDSGAVQNPNTLQSSVAKSTISSLLKILDESTITAPGFTPGISLIDTSRAISNQGMLFGGTENFMRLHPEKTRFLEFASKGLADGLFVDNTNPLSVQLIQEFSNLLGEATIESCIQFTSSLEGDNSIFTYEALKAISTGLTLGAVYKSSSSVSYRESALPETTAELISNSISSQAITSTLELNGDFELNRIAESTASGSAMGAQLASILDQALDYKDGWELYSRNAIAKATSKGSANGSINAASKKIENDLNIEDTLAKTTRQEVLDVANGSALGSLMGTTGLAFYYPTMMQSIINHAAQGATFGGVTATNLALVEKPEGTTEEFEIEISRAISHGSATGALFQIVSLIEDSMPDKRSFDTLTIETAEAVSFGSTYGGILGGIDAGEDSVSLKQAVYQGTLEGSKVGTSLGLGYKESVAELVSIPSDNQIKKVIKSANDDAASKANSTMAVKSIQTSAQDMLLLMRKFNINPKFTNPTGIFTNPNENNQDNFIYKNKFPFASPI